MAIDYVYALHDFMPENDDEVPFKAGERIEVIEKDDMYGDGWWKGRNLAGREGLFPESYTTVAPPVPPIPAHLLEQALDKNPAQENGTAAVATATSKEADVGSSAQPPSIYINGQETESSHSEEMQATMTDVQQAIEQLGRGTRGTSFDDADRDGARSFSFASSRGDADTDRETDTDFDLSDVDHNGEDGEGWHKGAREKLAEKARRAVEEAEKLEMMMGGSDSNRYSAPPFEVEMSDESEGEGEEEDYTKSSSYFRRHSRIPEVDEEEEQDESHAAANVLLVPEVDETQARTATATQSTFLPVEPPSGTATPPPSQTPPVRAVSPPTESLERASSPLRDSITSAISPTNSSIFTGSGIPPPGLGEATSQDVTASSSAKRMSSPIPSQLASSSPRNSLPHQQPALSPSSAIFPSSHSAVFGSDVAESPLSTVHSSTTTASPTTTAPTSAATETAGSPLPADPATWDLQNVLVWLTQRGFDETVREKFTEQEITGDVLLELDIQVLKNEIGIMAFGKRARIVAAIGDLKRSMGMGSETGSPIGPSGSFGSAGISPQPQYSPAFFNGGGVPQSPHSLTHSTGHSRTQSQSQQSARSFPGSIAGSNLDISAEGVGLGLYQNSNGATNGNGTVNGKSRPANLHLPSDVTEEALSENETAATTSSSRRRFFGRSMDSTNSRRSGSRSPAPSPADRDSIGDLKDKEAKDKDKDKDSTSTTTTGSGRHARNKKSIDGGKGGGERLSIFGSAFTPSLGKSRKPPPRYSSIGEDAGAISGGEEKKEKSSSAFHIPRFNGQRKSSGRPGSSSGLKDKHSKEEEKKAEKAEKAEKGTKESISPRSSGSRDPHLLRKRTSSYPGPNSKEKEKDKDKEDDARQRHNSEGGELMKSMLKPGQSVLEQIGEPDHAGWMKKKGEKYGWKLRYFVLKGPHLYYLRSDNTSETKIKGYIHIVGYKVTVDENVNPGKYGFRIDHDQDKTHYFSSDEKGSIREWMKAIMKATIGRDYTKPVVSSCNIPTIPLMVAQTMNPAPRPPSPTARDATQKALRRENPNQLSSRDARVLMGLPNPDSRDPRERLDTFFTHETTPPETNGTVKEMAALSPLPPRPSREARRASISTNAPPSNGSAAEDGLIEWANDLLPLSYQITDTSGSICSGLTILRLAEAIKGRPSSPPVPDSAFPVDAEDDKLEGLFRLFDFLLDNDVKMGSVSINDIRQGKRDKIIQLLKALKAWEEKRIAIVNSIGKGSVHAGGFMAPAASPMFNF